MIDYSKNEYKPGTVVNMYGRHLTLFYCLQNLWKLLDRIRFIMTQSLGQVEQKKGEIIVTGLYTGSDDDLSGKNHLEYEADPTYELTNNETLMKNFLTNLKERLNPFFQDKTLLKFLNIMSAKYGFFFYK